MPRFDLDSYVPVNERIMRFYDKFPGGRILTSVVENDREAGFVLMRAEVYRNAGDDLPAATGHAYEVKGGQGPQATSHIEVCETSAVGRALALLGFEVSRSAGREETPARTSQVSRDVDVDERRARYNLRAKELWGTLKSAEHPVTKRHTSCFSYINEKFEVEGGQNALGFSDFEKLIVDLEGKLKEVAVNV